jgi:pyruvate formate lyase activating enzyme
MKEAMFWKPLPGGRVRCHLCPRKCVILPGREGFCGVRHSEGGRLYSLVYGKACSMSIDPIEKKPLHHFRPGTHCLSVCTLGCNLDCSFCQNWDISHPGLSRKRVDRHGSMPIIPGDDVPPERIVEIAVDQGVEGIAYTYTEPTIFFEYALDIMKLARKAGLYNVWVSNGFTCPEPAMEASRYLDAINIDIKGSGAFYRKLCNAPSEASAKKAARIYREQGVWVEITTLVVPGYNDSDRILSGISRWVARDLGKETPIHFSRFHPEFRLTEVEPTPARTLMKARELARKAGLKNVYIGNVPPWELEGPGQR